MLLVVRRRGSEHYNAGTRNATVGLKHHEEQIHQTGIIGPPNHQNARARRGGGSPRLGGLPDEPRALRVPFALALGPGRERHLLEPDLELERGADLTQKRVQIARLVERGDERGEDQGVREKGGGDE